MKKHKGIHFYINIKNFNEIIIDEEEKYNGVERSIHALDTFFSSIENYGEIKFKDTFHVEKITGSRLHLYVVDSIKSAFDTVSAVSAFAYRISRVINKEIGKYKNLLDFSIQIGAAYGNFYDFIFEDGKYQEETTIGYAANFAAKLQALTRVGRISVSKDIFDLLDDDFKEEFEEVEEESIKKYDQKYYYTVSLSKLKSPLTITNADIDYVKVKANRINLYEINYSSAYKSIDFSNLSTRDCKSVMGIPVFADVRGFTEQFDSDDDNLAEMAAKTQKVLSSMYGITQKSGGIHVQFQGDRELSLYHDIPNAEPCFKGAVIAAMRIIDAIKPLKLHIGVGEDYGRLFATRIGARCQKDNILLGETVINADYLEDNCAEEDELAITKEVYDGLIRENSILATRFQKSGNIYVAHIGFKEYIQFCESMKLKDNTDNKAYNPAWRDWL